MKQLLLLKNFNLKSGILLFCFFLFASSAMASHFRHGTISWRVVSGNTVEFKISQAWANFGNWSVGQTGYSDQLYFGDGQSRVFAVVATAVNPSENWYYGETTITHTYANAGNFIAYFQSCCKISNLSNNANAWWRNETIVNVGSGNESPVTTMAPIINMQTGTTAATFQVPASDPDGDKLTYRLATYNEFRGGQPSGISIHPTTGLITFNTQGRTLNSLWNAAIVVEDGQTKVINDFIIKIVQQSNPPVFDYTVTPTNGQVFQVSPGVPVNFSVKADDTDPGATVSLQSIGVPPGATIVLNNQNTNSITGVFSWTPTASNLGTNVINFLAQDNVGTQVSTSVTILVSLKPQFDVPPTPAQGVHNVYNPGDLISYMVQASDPDPLDVVSFTDVKGKDMAGLPIPLYTNASFSNLNGVPANPASGTFSWTTQPSDWGHKYVYFYVTDSYGDVTRHEVSQIINTPPVFASAPVTTADVGTPYSYIVNVSDADIKSGDEIKILGSTIPSWLTLTDNGDGTATLSGTPTVADVGTASVNILAEDKNHHEDSRGSINQIFDITVNNCFVNAFASDFSVTLNSNGTATITTDDIDNGSTATCGIASISLDKTNFDCSNVGNNTVTLTVTDNNGNISTATASVNVNDGSSTSTFDQADYINIGNSSYLGNAQYRLTSAVNGQFGGVWYQNKLDLSSDFELDFDVYLGTADFGADGMAFVLQPLSTNEGASGGGLGYLGISPSLAVEFDTYQNPEAADPSADHVALTQNGNTFHNSGNTLSGPHVVSNLENGAYHNVKISWNHTTNTLVVVFKGSTIINYTGDVVNDIFSGNSGVFWGFTAATGGLNNEHRVKINTVSFVEELSITSQSITPASCSDSLDGAIDISISQDSPCISYSWSNGETTQDISNLNPGEYTVTISKSDGTIISQTFTVDGDTTPPTVITQDISVDLDAVGNATITAAMIDNGSSDVCGIASYSLDTTNFSCANVGAPNVVTLTVTDINGNVSTATANVTVNDVTAPTVATQDIVIHLDASGSAVITADMIDNGSSDSCGIASLVLDVTSFDCSNTGDNTVTLTATDVNGNKASLTANVTVNDITAPTVITQNISVTLVDGMATITPEDVNNGSFDNCAFTLSLDNNSFSCSDIGSNTVTLTATDASNNSTSMTAVVNVIGDVPTVAINDFYAVQTQKVNTIFLGFGPQSINLSTAVTGGSGFTYEWTTSTGEVVSNEANPSISPTVSTTYNVTVTNSNGCTASTSLYVCVIDARAFDNKGRYNGKVVVCHHTNGKKGTKHVEIEINASAIMAHLTQHGVGTDHADSLGACDATCVDASSAKSQSVETVSISDNLLVYPNPSNGIFDVQLRSVELDTNISLFNLAGQLIESKVISKENSFQNIITIGNHNLSSGVYILKIENQNESVVKKVVIN